MIDIYLFITLQMIYLLLVQCVHALQSTPIIIIYTDLMLYVREVSTRIQVRCIKFFYI